MYSGMVIVLLASCVFKRSAGQHLPEEQVVVFDIEYTAFRRNSGVTESRLAELNVESLEFPRWYLDRDDWKRLSQELENRLALSGLNQLDLIQFYSSEPAYLGQNLFQSSQAVSVFYFDADHGLHHRFYRLHNGAFVEDLRLYDLVDGGIGCETVVALQKVAHGQIPARSLVYSLLSKDVLISSGDSVDTRLDDDLKRLALTVSASP